MPEPAMARPCFSDILACPRSDTLKGYTKNLWPYRTVVEDRDIAYAQFQVLMLQVD